MPTLLALEPLLTLLYPPRCAVCRALGGPSCLCAACLDAIAPVPAPFCVRCGHTLRGFPHCFHCHARTPAFACARAMGAYEGVLRDAIHQFKYRDRPQLAEPLGARLAEYARVNARDLNGLAFDAVVPVPMHPARKRLRGYNQAERLACVAARELQLPHEPGLLVRPRPTRPQVGLEAAARHNNLADAFQSPPPAGAHGKALLLIDDVSTTTTTLHACARALQTAGAASVYALTLAAG